MLLVIDNYDSFTYNLVHYLRELGVQLQVFFSDRITVAEVLELRPSQIVISPGPGRPEEAGIIVPLIKALQGQIPILGVCLGHQAIGAAYGAKIISSAEVMHGKTSLIHHNGTGIFNGIDRPFTAMRYHSLVIDPQTSLDDFLVTAWAKNKDDHHREIMAIQHRHYPIAGVQFHPESIVTEFGHYILKNFLENHYVT